MDSSYSVVIPTLNAEEEIDNLLTIILQQEPKPHEILVVDSSSDDRTSDIVSSFENVRLKVIDRKDFDHGGTRHSAFIHTTGDFVCFLTQDAIPVSNSSFANLLKPFRDPDVAMTTGRQIPKPDARPFERLVRSYNYPSESFMRIREDIPKLGIKAYFASDTFAAYRRTAYMDAGGFEYPINTNEDMLMAASFLRLGYKVVYAADAKVLHSHNLTFRQQYRRNYQIGLFLASHPDVFAGLNEVGEGKKLVIEVSKQLVKEGRPLELAAFGADCAARILGNRLGRMAASKKQKNR